LRKGWIIGCGIAIFLFGAWDVRTQIMAFRTFHRFLGFPFFVHCLIFLAVLVFLHFHNTTLRNFAEITLLLYCVIFPAGFFINLFAHKTFSLPYTVGFAAALGTAIIEEIEDRELKKKTSTSAGCNMCGKRISPVKVANVSGYTDAELNRALSFMVQAGLAGSIGYICQTCGSVYCHRCLESCHNVCPKCGGIIWAYVVKKE